MYILNHNKMKIRILVSLLVLTLSYFCSLVKKVAVPGGQLYLLSAVLRMNCSSLCRKLCGKVMSGILSKEFFGQPQLGLPQGEPVFDLINLPPSNFEKMSVFIGIY